MLTLSDSIAAFEPDKNPPMNQLAACDLSWCCRSLPKSLRELLWLHPGRLFVAGGFIRSCVTGEAIQDIDCFAPSQEEAKSFADDLLASSEPGAKVVKTGNTYTVLGACQVAVQFIYRWTFDTPQAAIESFDFTIARAAIWCTTEVQHVLGDTVLAWASVCDPDFYADLAAKRLIYKSPDRNEDAGGSILRVLKFYKRGYRIPVSSLAAVVARLVAGIKFSALPDVNKQTGERMDREEAIAYVLTGLLREVDPIYPTNFEASEERPFALA